MAGWPPNIVFALQEIGNQYPGDELSVEGFVSRWGGLEFENLLQALRDDNDEDEDRIFAILAIAHTNNSEAREILSPFLESHHPKLRWVSAYCLGKMGDERAYKLLPIIAEEFLPPNEQYVEYEGEIYEDWFYEDWRPRISEIVNKREGIE